jgi:hypothetical protein
LITGAPATGAAPSPPPWPPFSSFFFLFSSSAFRGPLAVGVGLGLQKQERGHAAADQHDGRRGRDDDHHRRLLLSRSFALDGALFAFRGGSILGGFVGHARGSLESMDLLMRGAWLTMSFEGHFAAG